MIQEKLQRLLKISVSGDEDTLIALVSAAVVTAATIFSLQYLTRKKTKKLIRKSLEESTPSSLSYAPQVLSQPNLGFLNNDSYFQEDVIKEQLARNYAFLGEKGVNDIRKSFVIVVGLGGVGSHAAHMLLRSGVEHLRLIDFDQVSLSSLNRHAVATQNDVGSSKSLCLQTHFSKICPHAKIEAIIDLFSLKSAEKLLSGSPTYVLDCIDNVATKLELIKYCVDHKIPIVSSMGSGAKADPSRIQVADISDTLECPLARATRRGLKKMGVTGGVDVVYSIEKPGSVGLVPLEEEKVENATEFSALPNFRVRILPVLGTIPAIFGCAMATHVITKIGGFPTEPLASKNRKSLYTRVWLELNNNEKLLEKTSDNISISTSDVAFIIEEVWRGRGSFSGAITDKLLLVRFDNSKKAGFGNLILLSKFEAEVHRTLGSLSEVEEHYGKEKMEYIRSRFSIEKLWSIERMK